MVVPTASQNFFVVILLTIVCKNSSKKVMPTCKGLRQEVIDCILLSDCVVVDGKSVKECLIGDRDLCNRKGDGADGVPDRCRQLQAAHKICIRGMLDKRNRLVGFTGY